MQLQKRLTLYWQDELLGFVQAQRLVEILFMESKWWNVKPSYIILLSRFTCAYRIHFHNMQHTSFLLFFILYCCNHWSFLQLKISASFWNKAHYTLFWTELIPFSVKDLYIRISLLSY